LHRLNETPGQTSLKKSVSSFTVGSFAASTFSSLGSITQPVASTLVSMASMQGPIAEFSWQMRSKVASGYGGAISERPALPSPPSP
jgi:hypothetical protein